MRSPRCRGTTPTAVPSAPRGERGSA
jgi:hypothetical protein